MFKTIASLVLAALGSLAASADAATVLFCTLDRLDGWTVRTLGPATVQAARGPADSDCVELRSEGGAAFLTRDLPLAEVAGRRLTLSCLAATEGVVRGPQAASTAKLHLAVQTPQGVRHFSTRLTGSGPWRREGLEADVPADATRAVLNLGLEACRGRLALAQLSLRSDRRAAWPLNLAAVANAAHGQIGLAAVPQGKVEWQGIPFEPLDAVGPAGDCLRLRGAGHDDWPPAAGNPIPVGRHASAIYILHAALGGRAKADTPCAIWTAKTVGGSDVNLSVFEGRDIGSVESTDDLDNWRIAWRQHGKDARPISFGVTKWPLYVDAPVVSLSCRAYDGAAVVVLAVTVVEEPPPKPSIGGDDEVEE